MEDVHATQAYRRHLAQVLTTRALETAYARAVAGVRDMSGDSDSIGDGA